MKSKSTVAICGAGIAGVATAYYLLQKEKDFDVILIDKHQPLSFTTSKSGENFRNYWPQECMQEFISHSIELMTQLRNEFGNDSFDMVYSGYNFISHDRKQPIFGIKDEMSFEGELETNIDPDSIQNEYPYLDSTIQKIVSIKNAGNIDVYDLGSLMLCEVYKKKAQLINGEILSIAKRKSGFEILLNSKESINADKVVIAAGPFMNNIAGMMDLEFPIFNTLQRKVIIPDPKNIIPKSMPFSIYSDAQYLDWSPEEMDFFSSEKKCRWLLDEFPGGLHIKPVYEGIKMGWAFHTKRVFPDWEQSKSDLFPQVVLKGASRFIPRMIEYENDIPAPLIEYAGYYTRTKENWPLIGPAKLKNVYVVGALAGYGTMSACAAGELCAEYVIGKSELPSYAKYFNPNRYQVPEMIKSMEQLQSDGQL